MCQHIVNFFLFSHRLDIYRLWAVCSVKKVHLQEFFWFKLFMLNKPICVPDLPPNKCPLLVSNVMRYSNLGWFSSFNKYAHCQSKHSVNTHSFHSAYSAKVLGFITHITQFCTALSCQKISIMLHVRWKQTVFKPRIQQRGTVSFRTYGKGVRKNPSLFFSTACCTI